MRSNSRVFQEGDKKITNVKQTDQKWGMEKETEIFSEKVKLFRQGKLSEDDFRRFRLQHGAYGSRYFNELQHD